MTKEELYRMRRLPKIIKDLTEEYKERVELIDGLPSTCSNFSEVRTHNIRGSVTEKFTIELCQLEDVILEYKIEYIRLLKKFYLWQQTLNDPFLRIVLELYFALNYTYPQIAKFMNDKPKKSRYEQDEFTESACRMKVSRFFKANM